jgi:tetratricopeptide (TPR) repeat protein/class 3 adenylate cyclase
VSDQALNGPAPEAADRWATVEKLLAEAMERDAGERADYLDRACPDPEMRAEVEDLLRAHDRRGPLDALVEEVMEPLRDRTAGGSARTSAQPATDPLPTLSRYRVVERLGGGGMGVVYRARDERLDRDVALKFLPPHLSTDEAAKKRFLVEARAAAALDHPNVCTVHEIGETDDGQLYIVMGCYDGETLDKRIARGPLPVDDAVRIAGEIARGLAKAHERGIVHRDVKPQNVMLTRDGIVKVLDFGIAKLADANVTHTVGGIGTMAYMSPEQAFGEAVDHRTDVWALGVVAYEMLAGVRPFSGPTPHAILVATLTGEPEPLSSVRTDVPRAFDAVIGRALGKKPADRFDSVLEFSAALATTVASEVGTPAREEPPSTTDASDGAHESRLTRGGERRHATVVAGALTGVDALFEQLAPEQADRVLARVRAAANEVATYHGGVVNHFSGEELVMLFGVPTAHEDDSVRAVRAALALRARIAEIDPAPAGTSQRVALRLRAGVHTGSLVAQRLRSGDRRFRVTGAPLEVASRLADLALTDEILVSPECRRLVAPFVETVAAPPVSLRAGAAPVVPHIALREIEEGSRLEHSERAGLSPFAGRGAELATLEEQLAYALKGKGHLTIVTGEAGTGKSRLLHELRMRGADAGARLVVGRCDAYGESTPFRPFVQAVRDVLWLAPDGPPEDRHDHVVAATNVIDPSLDEYLPLYLALLSIPSEQHPVPEHWRDKGFHAAMLDALTALFALQAARTPTLLLLEDWHWADEASQGTLRQLGEVVASVPLLVVVTSRPEGIVGWESAEHQTRLHLGPIDLEAAAAIVRAVFGAERVSPELAAQLYERTGGNPFFLEEVCLALREDEAVTVRDGEAMACDRGVGVHLPDSVQGVIGTRIDRLDPVARDVLLVASVIGREFTRGVLSDAADKASDLAPALDRLKASGLVQQSGFVPEPAYRFKHVVTQEVAYESLLEHQRKALHGAVGRAIERRYAASLDDHVARLAQHFTLSGDWADAVQYGIRSADRATALSQYAEALAELERAERSLLELPDDAQRLDTLASILLREDRLCLTLGDRAGQRRIVERLVALLAPHGASAGLARAYIRQGDVYALVQRFEDAEVALEKALQLSIELGDAALESNALRSFALMRSFQGRFADAYENIARVLAIGRERGDTASEHADLATLGNILRRMGQVDRAIEEMQPGIARAANAGPTGRCAYFEVLGALHVARGEYAQALDYFQRGLDEATERRLPVVLAYSLAGIAGVYFEQGRVEDFIDAHRRNIEMSRKARYAEGEAQALLTLGASLAGLGRDAEALPYLEDAAKLYRRLEYGDTEMRAWREIAGVQQRLGRHREAREAWERVRQHALQMEERHAEMDALEGIARASQSMGDAGGAIADYEAARHLARILGERERELALHNALGILHWQHARDDDALAHYEAALAICRDLDDRVHEGLILNSIGVVLHRLGRRDEALATLAEAARVNEATGQRRLESHSLATLGDVLASVGRLEAAREAIEASLVIRRETGDRRGEGWMLERLARILDGRGTPTEADRCRQDARAIANELHDAALLDALERTENPTKDDPNARGS